MRRPARVLHACAATALLASPALAADRANTRRFSPSPVLSPYLTLDGSRTHGEGGVAFGAIGTFEQRPLIFYKDGARTTDIVGDRLTLDVAFAYGVLPWLDVGLGAPLVLGQSGRQTDTDAALASFAFGDPSLAAKAELLDKHERVVGVAVLAVATLPVGAAAAFVGEPNATGTLKLAAEVPLGPRFDVGANAGYRLRERTRIDQIAVDDELLFGLGASARLTPAWSLVAEANLAARATAPFAVVEETPADANAGLRYRLWHGLHAVAGGGTGLRPGYGSPEWRAFVGFEAGPRRHDFDGDRVVDGRDACVEVPGVPELEGCPPAPVVAVAPPPAPPGDLDGDGVPDARDLCPYLPEDRDGLRDDDGCPEPDNDLDLIADAYDGDPIGPEDWDGHQDDDGIPDLDNDRDGIADYRDACPNEPGAGDGCPASGPPQRAVAASGGGPGGPAPGEGPNAPLVLGDTIHPHRPILFEFARPQLSAEAREPVEGLAEFLIARPELGRVEVGVHVDALGSRAWKEQLSRHRAESVRAALVERGVPADRLVARGYGPGVPVADNETQDGRRTNRRVELRLLDRSAGTETDPPRPPPAPSPARPMEPPAGADDGPPGLVIRPPEPILFEVQRPQLTPGARAQVEALAAVLRAHPEYQRVEVGVHTDGRGEPRARMRLSEQRAREVTRALVAAGVAAERLVPRGYGGTRTLGPDKTAADRARNRRVELTVLEVGDVRSALDRPREEEP